MKIVNIREDNKRHLAYFIDVKKIIEVNEIGAMILDLFFNQEIEMDLIAKQIQKKYEIPSQEVVNDIKVFFEQINIEFSPKIYNSIEQQQLCRPLGVEIEITQNCNLQCRHCFQKYHPNLSMSLDKISSIIDILVANKIFEVVLIGGEPMTHKNIMDILRICENKDLAYSIVTNGTLIDKKVVKEFQKLSRLSVMVSLEGNKLMHESIRGVGTFKKVNNVLHSLIEHEIEVEALCTLNAENSRGYREVADYCREIGIVCNFNLFKPFWPEQKNLALDPDIYFSSVIALLKMRQYEGYDIGISNAAIVSELLDVKFRNECRATCSGLAVNVYGKMVTCPLLEVAGYYKNQELPVFDENFVQKWQNHSIFKNFRKNNIKECQARALIFSGDICGKDPYGISEFRQFQKNI